MEECVKTVEDKRMALARLQLFFDTTQEKVTNLVWNEDKETVDVYYDGQFFTEVNIAMDSCCAMALDILKAVLYG